MAARRLQPVFILLLLPGCKETHPPDPALEVAAYLMPPGRSRVELLLERRVSGPGREPLRQPRLVVAERTREGVLYRVKERVKSKEWRTAAKLLITATAEGAYLTHQEDLMGQPVGVRERRLLFPWPLRAGAVRSLEYRLLGPQEDGGRRASARVSVTRTAFAEVVAGKTYAPCVEVRELLTPDVGGRLDLRSVWCRGVGRVRIEQRNESLSRGESHVLDQLIRLGAGGS